MLGDGQAFFNGLLEDLCEYWSIYGTTDYLDDSLFHGLPTNCSQGDSGKSHHHAGATGV